MFPLVYKMMIIFCFAIFNIVILALLMTVTIVIVKNDSLMRKSTNKYEDVSAKTSGVTLLALEAFYKGIGQLLVLMQTLLFIPTLICFAEIERCQQLTDANPQPSLYFQCMDSNHSSAIALVTIGSIALVSLSVFSCLFLNSQFPSPENLPNAVWEAKTRSFMVFWAVIYCFHYDILGSTYRVVFRIACLYLVYLVIRAKMDQPKIYNIVIHRIELFSISTIALTNAIIVLKDFGFLNPLAVSPQILPLLFLLAVLIFGILFAIEQQNHKQIIARDNREHELFETEQDMELYINILLGKLKKLMSGGRGKTGDQYGSSPQIFTIISRHMQHCVSDECICKKYEPEFDKKFSSAFSSRRLTKRVSQTSFMSSAMAIGGQGDSYSFRKKIPVKINYDSKCAIFMAELADCLERFLATPQCRVTGGGVGLKLQKSYFYHAYMDSSYKALFVQLENSYQCNTMRGKINIYHLKTRIQEEMKQSEASPLSYLDITTCLKFEMKRLIFEQRIIDLCLSCEQFWSELINKSGLAAQKQKARQQKHKQDTNINKDNIEDQDESARLDASFDDDDQVVDDYNVEKMNDTILEIAALVIDVKALFLRLCSMNPQSVAVLNSYALVYRYILRDEYRYEEIVNSLGQLHRTNKLEQYRDNTPMFCDSDDYALLLVSGDLKDLGRILRVNRGADSLFGYTPDELRGSKIQKLMPSLYAEVHEEFMHSFLKRGHSNFIDKNQFILSQNKHGFLTMVLSYIKAMVDLKLGLMFVGFYKSPIKVPLTYDNKDGGCSPQLGTTFVRTKDAHFLLCDGKGNIHGMSQNCMRDLGLPPTLVIKSIGANNKQQNQNQILDIGDNRSAVGQLGSVLININRFAPNIMGPEYEFDLVKGMNFGFETSCLKQDKALVREFPEIKNRMCRYNIQVTLRRTEYRQRSGTGTVKSINVHELLLYTIVINSYAFTDTPNIIIPVFRDEDEQIGQIMLPMAMIQTAKGNDDMRSSKFKEFKAHVQEMTMPSKISKLRKITLGFFIFLLGVFSLNYGICVSQNQTFNDRIVVRDILFQLTNMVPSTARYVRTVVNIANGFEPLTNEVLTGIAPWENRFNYYMRRISENAEIFRQISQTIQTQYRSQLNIDSNGNSTSSVSQIVLSSLQTDYSITNIYSSIASALNLYLSYALQVSQLQQRDLAGIIVPYVDYRYNLTLKQAQQLSQSQPASNYQQDLYFIIHNGNEVLPGALRNLSDWSDSQVIGQSQTFSNVSLAIAIASMIAILIVVVPLVYPLLTHYELIAEIILHSLNKLTRTFIENEVKNCNLLYNQISQKTASEQAAKAAVKQLEQDDYADAMTALKKAQSSSKARRGTYGEDAKRFTIQHSDQINLNSSPIGINLNSLPGAEIGSMIGSGIDSGNINHSLRRKKKTSKIVGSTGFTMDDDGKPQLRKYQRRGHMPPVLRRASFYDRMQFVEEFDSFGEDASNSNNSSVSNYTNQVFQNQQLQEIKQAGLLDPDQEERNIYMSQYDLNQAKSSDMPFEPLFLRNPEEEADLKKLVKSRQRSIQQSMKKRRVKKLIAVSLFVVAISIYITVNTIYTNYVFTFENELQQNLKFIDNRMLCYPFSLSVVKEMLSRGSSVQDILDGFGGVTVPNNTINREQIVRCYSDEQEFTNLLMGNSQYSSNLASVTSNYMLISEQLEASSLCSTLIAFDSLNPDTIDYIPAFCSTIGNGINTLGMHEVLNFILREEEKIVIEFQNPGNLSLTVKNLLMNSTLSEEEALTDIFLSIAMNWERSALVGEINTFAAYLFKIFDILFGVFVAALCIATAFVGLLYITRVLQKQILQVYHIVMLIPYGDRTKKELNELIKIDL